MSAPTVEADESSRLIRVALIGNPNTGKSTLFGAIAGLHAHVGNYPGVTVEKKVGRVEWSGRQIDLIDLPGAYSLSPRTMDEMVSVEVLTGHQSDVGDLDVVVCIADASNLERNFYLLSQVLEIGVPIVVVLNMWDAAERAGIKIDVDQLRARLGVPVVVTEAHRRKGLEELKSQILASVGTEPASPPQLFPESFYGHVDTLSGVLETGGVRDLPTYQIERLLLDVGGYVERSCTEKIGESLTQHLETARHQLAEAGCRVPSVEATTRYAWAGSTLNEVVSFPEVRQRTMTDKLDSILTHRFSGFVIFCAMMFVIFQALYTWAAPLMDLCEAGQGAVTAWVETLIGPGALRSLLVDGVVAGVGGVVIFLPQIVLLFFFIALLEDCGYMSRAAFMMDRIMARFGLSGKSFLPLMSSFACAIPGVMATRVIENRRDRMVTILVAPLMSCSARLPVYLLLIGAFIPDTRYVNGLVSLQALVLFGMTSLGAILAVPIAILLRKTLFKGEASPFVLEMPEYKVPSFAIVFNRVYDRAKAFLVRAGTLIFASTVLIWAAGYFPGDHAAVTGMQAELTEIEETPESERTEQQNDRVAHLEEAINFQSADLISGSFLGRAGHAIEPLVEPIGWDWKIGIGVLASFPAREVVIATLGTIYSLGGDVDEEDEGLVGALQSSAHPDGTPVYNIPVALSLMVFFALCAQCASTLMIMRRETNSWRWPAFCFVYMTTLAYVGALLTYRIGMMI